MQRRPGRTNLAGLTTALAPIALASIYLAWLYRMGEAGRQAVLHPSASISTINPLTHGLLIVGNVFIVLAFIALIAIRLVYRRSLREQEMPEDVLVQAPSMRVEGVTVENTLTVREMFRTMRQMHDAERQVMDATLGNEQERAAGASALLAQARHMIELGRSDEGYALLTALTELSVSNDAALKQVAREANERIEVNPHR